MLLQTLSIICVCLFTILRWLNLNFNSYFGHLTYTEKNLEGIFHLCCGAFHL
jgi:hypothetical protein